MKKKKSYLVGVTGGSGSGKTLFISKLAGSFSDGEICVISQDNYYSSIEKQQKDENGIENFDAPKSIDLEDFIRDIKALQSGKTVQRKEYTFNNTKAKSVIITLYPAPVIVVEGIFILSNPEIFKLLDLKIFIEAKDHIRLKRRIKRDNDERGYDLADVLYRYERHVTPTFEKYIEPFKQSCDLVIPNNTGFDNALDVVQSFLKSKLPD